MLCKRLEILLSMIVAIAFLAASSAEEGERTPVADLTSAPGDRPEAVRIDDQQVRRWIDDLDSDNFVIREAATAALIGAGTVSIDALMSVMPRGSLEVISRAIHVLRELALSDDTQVEQAARAALARIATSSGTSTARRATATLEVLDEMRQRRAITELVRLGAEIREGAVQFRLALAENTPTISIGEKWTGQAKDLQRLKWLSNVFQITLSGLQVTDEYLKHVARMENLRYILIKRAAITDEAMSYLKRLENLSELTVMYSPITDHSVQHLQAHKRAREIKLYGTEMSRNGVQQLERAMANVKIDYRQGAFLGVGCLDHEQGCEISIVQENSAAAKSDLQVGDVIVKYEQQNVRRFDNLTQLIAENRPGDTVTLEILREQQQLQKKITLGEWE